MVAACTVASASATLFALEPFVGKVLLPRLGGAATVWNTCMLVFQLLLLLGYGYSMVLARLATRCHARALRVHTGCVALAIFITPFSIRWLWVEPRPEVSPVYWIVAVVMGAIGLPFCLLSATSSLVQSWLARADPPLPNVHRLYGVASLANFAGLGLYVAVLEPLFGVHLQAWILCGCCFVALVLSLYVAHNSRLAARPPVQRTAAESRSSPSTLRVRMLWVLRSFAASCLLFAVSTYLATDVAAFPMLFVIPLSLFLLGFGLGYSAWAERRRDFLHALALVVGLLAVIPSLLGKTSLAHLPAFVAPLLSLLCLVTTLASRLADARPLASERLPEYYAAIGVGGVLAGVTCVLLVPWAWTTIWGNTSYLATPSGSTISVFETTAIPEYPFALLLGMTLVTRGWPSRVLVSACISLAAVGGIRTTLPSATTLYQTRNFYGTVRVKHDPPLRATLLVNGTTIHGVQPEGSKEPKPVAYYGRRSGIGWIMDLQQPKRVLVVGLGAGTLAAYARAGDQYDFLELNPSVAQLAENSPWFTYIAAARQRGAEIRVHVGDGRRLLASLDPQARYDLIALDAFSSDAIPVHLLTREAFAAFAARVTPDGLIAVHVSNEYFDLTPVVTASGRDLGWTVSTMPFDTRAALEYNSVWMSMTRSPARSAQLGMDTAPWFHAADERTARAWTDDWANPLGNLRVIAQMQKAAAGF